MSGSPFGSGATAGRMVAVVCAAQVLVQIGAFFLRTDTELILKSRRVVPGRLLDAGFTFAFPDWPAAARQLVERWRAGVRA